MTEETRVPEVVDNVSEIPEVEDKATDPVDPVQVKPVVDMKDFEAVVNELKEYKEQSQAEIAELREYKARQEAEIKAKDLIGLPGISDERRIELARTADDRLFEELKSMALAMNELTKPVGETVRVEDAFDNKEELELRKKIKDYAAENEVTEQEAYYAVVNGGK